MGLDSFMKSVLGAFIQSPQNARNRLITTPPATGCPVVDCIGWPYKGLKFSFGALSPVVTTISPDSTANPDPACCVPGIGPSIRMLGLAECFSQEWKLTNTIVFSSTIVEDGIEKLLCTDRYTYGCLLLPILGVEPDYTIVDMALGLGIDVDIITKRNQNTNVIESTSVDFVFSAYIASVIFPGTLSPGCLFNANYNKKFDGQNCGPWEIDLDFALTKSPQLSGLPLKLVLTPIDEYTPGPSSTCCGGLSVVKCIPPTWNCQVSPPACSDPETNAGTYSTKTICQTACAVTESYNCIAGTGCIDPNNSSGVYTNITDCHTYCDALVRYNCVSGEGCVSPGGGLGTYSDLAMCNAVCNDGGGGIVTYDCNGTTCVEVSGPGGQYSDRPSCQTICSDGNDDRDRCCPGGSPSQQLICVITSSCPGLSNVITLAWQVGESAYVGSYFSGLDSTPMIVKIACDGNGQWFGQLFCGQQPIVDIPLTSEFCSPSVATNTITLVPIMTPCCPGGGSIQFTIYQP